MVGIIWCSVADLLFTLRRLLCKMRQSVPRKAMKRPPNNHEGVLLRFATGDPDEFVERISLLAPGLSCRPMGPRAMNIEICGARLPGLGMFASTLQNFRVRSPIRPYYGVTISLEGQSEFLVEGAFDVYHKGKVHLLHPDKLFDAKMGEAALKSLQLCFDPVALNSMANRLLGSDCQNIRLMETLDLARPTVQSFVRHATFIWSEVLRAGPIVTSPLVAQESVQLLGTLLVAAADPENPESAKRSCSPPAIRRAEDYLMDHLSGAISVADVAMAAGVSARTLSREFRRHRGTTVKEFARERRLEAANRALLAAESGETNVTQVALEFGFDQLGRFSADYKRAFGEFPSETLAH